jgi:hypothetical protein
MTFDEKIKAYEIKTRRLETIGKVIRNVLLGISTLITSVTGLVIALIH